MTQLRAPFLVWILLLAACSRDKPSGESSSAAASAQAPADLPSRFAATGWPEDAGPVVILPSADPAGVRIILPELTDKSFTDTSSFILDSLPNGAVALFSQTRNAISATVAGGESEDEMRGCKSWPSARLDAPPRSAWRFGLAKGSALELPLQAWGTSLSADSVGAAADVIRIANNTKGDSVFSGIPFSVRYLFRVDLNGARVVIGDAVRRINTEANVREEHTLIIAEKPEGASTYKSAYRETQAGREDEVKVPEILGAVLLGENRRPALFVSLEYSEGLRVFLLERISAAHWVMRWRSAYAGC